MILAETPMLVPLGLAMSTVTLIFNRLSRRQDNSLHACTESFCLDGFGTIELVGIDLVATACFLALHISPACKQRMDVDSCPLFKHA